MVFFSLEVLEVQVKLQYKAKQLYIQNEKHILKFKPKKNSAIWKTAKPLVNLLSHVSHMNDHHTYKISIMRSSLQFLTVFKPELWTETGIKGWKYKISCYFVHFLIQFEILTLSIDRLVKYFHQSKWHVIPFCFN